MHQTRTPKRIVAADGGKTKFVIALLRSGCEMGLSGKGKRFGAKNVHDVFDAGPKIEKLKYGRTSRTHGVSNTFG